MSDKQGIYLKLIGLAFVGLVLMASLVRAESPEIEVLEQHHDGVLGTSLDITIYANNKTQMQEAADLAVNEIARLEQIFSVYREDSEIMRLNQHRSSTSASVELLAVIDYCNAWRSASDGQFSCRLGQVLALWNEAESIQLAPLRPVVRRLARDISLSDIVVNSEQGSVKLGVPISLDPSGLSKGYIIDQAIAVLHKSLPNALAIKLDIGGDAVYWGSPPGDKGWQVGIADPVNTADNQGFIGTLALNSMAVAASGHNSRTRTIERKEFSHILMPRDGWPVEHGLSSVVIAKDAVSADAIATALSVQTLSEGVDWINSLPDVEALLIDADGRQLSSANWQDFLGDELKEQANTGLGFTLDYILPEFNVASYNRPYLAVWVSDTKQRALKNLLLLGSTERWARENTRWWRRVGRRNAQLLDGVARATRSAGEYQLQWDGLDDFGKQVPAGEYILHLEASRENGSSSYQKIAFSLGEGTQSFTLEPSGELGTIRLKIWDY